MVGFRGEGSRGVREAGTRKGPPRGRAATVLDAMRQRHHGRSPPRRPEWPLPADGETGRSDAGVDVDVAQLAVAGELYVLGVQVEGPVAVAEPDVEAHLRVPGLVVVDVERLEAARTEVVLDVHLAHEDVGEPAADVEVGVGLRRGMEQQVGPDRG